MSNEIKVGEYVRTIDGYIRKVIQVNKKGSYEGLCYGAYSVDEKYKNSVGISAKKIAKHSENIIDLIEVGDYLNGYLINYIPENEKTVYHDALDFVDVQMFKNKDIKTIVTKEQFKEMEYKV